MTIEHAGAPIPRMVALKVIKAGMDGIAKATQGKLTDQTLFTRFEQFIGTPVYMSPEHNLPGNLQKLERQHNLPPAQFTQHNLPGNLQPRSKQTMLSSA